MKSKNLFTLQSALNMPYFGYISYRRSSQSPPQPQAPLPTNMAITKHSSIHPFSDADKTFVINFVDEEFNVPTNPSNHNDNDNDNGNPLASPPESRADPLKRHESTASLTPSTVEAIMNGGHFGMAGPKAYEAAMWCGLGCFFVCGLVLLGGGLATVIRG